MVPKGAPYLSPLVECKQYHDSTVVSGDAAFSLMPKSSDYSSQPHPTLRTITRTLRGYSLMSVTADTDIFEMPALEKFCAQLWLPHHVATHSSGNRSLLATPRTLRMFSFVGLLPFERLGLSTNRSRSISE
ncbi:uncharacterized protein BKA55DRAFT_571721 [Fusarium redolens]|uniref:Uncharacterized protein n=1 Tax=Fusarium redolens TaxID=48865 RepID=A0A9P9K833_FUSRE|nr:uncharacterized protein BKA55DRAFT_571721 [Fusarium redolens]KAH7247410.1 hypothetical protein BKA55DRAFT_571721 [Fusarium redolens]